MSPLALSVLLSLVSAVAYAAGAILQERVAVATPARPYAPLHHGVWWIAVALNGLGALLHVGALAFGPLSLVQPLGALTIVFALPMAALFVGRRAGRTAWRGAVMATVGLAGLLSLTQGTDSHALDGGERLVLALATFGGVGLLYLVAQLVGRPVVRSVLLAGSAGVAFGIASVFTKTVTVDRTSESAAVQVPTLLVIAVLAAGGLLLSQASYRGAGLAAPLATVTVVNPVIAAAVGLTLFGESFRYGALGTALALVSGFVAAGGLILLTTDRMSTARQERSGSGAGAEPGAGWGTGSSRARSGRSRSGTSRSRSSSESSEDEGPPSGVRAGFPVPAVAAAPSDLDAARPEIGEGVDVGTVGRPRTHLEVEVRPGAVAGGS
ncbi:DMT family transporter [Streptomyces sp. NPDC051569]|uniref:DMT family transporter n=1 Tax=Streptomyces sp. NPDC051569 TaxID=3365661 RepID=UPI0037B01744